MCDRDDADLVERLAGPLRAPEPLEPTFEIRLESAVRAAVANGEVAWIRTARTHQRRGPRRWLTTRRQLTISPLAGLAAAACFAAIVAGATQLLSGRGLRPEPASVVASVPSAAPREVVHFAILAPNAATVALVGDFNGWDAGATRLQSSRANGLWTVTLPLAVGTYQYAFVINGTTWIADPASAIRVKDEFGVSNSVLIIQGGAA